MPVTTAARSFAPLLLVCALSFGAASALAQQMVSIAGSTVNMREGPSQNSAVLWELGRGYPLQVTGRRGGWLAVKDFEGDTGWVARSLTGGPAHHIVKSKVVNLRSGPGTRHRVLGKAPYGELLKTLEKRPRWVRVERATGDTGWVSRPLVWGW